MLKVSNLINSSFKPIKSIVRQKINAKIYAYTETVSIREFLPEDVFIVGYPKSGNSWFQNIIAGLVYGVNSAQTPDSVVQDLVPDVHYKRYYKRYQTPMFFKSHYLPDPKYRRVIYLLRDGRDVMVSYFHFLSTLKAKQNGTVNFLDLVTTGENLFQKIKWHKHVESWLANPYDAELVLLKYESLLQEPVKELTKLCQFLDLQPDEALLSKVAEETCFERMRNKEIKYGLNNPAWPKDKLFTRRGKIGSYLDEMPTEVLDAFLNEAGSTLARLGYSI